MRINYVNAILGRRGSGKTYYCKEELLPAYRAAHPGKKILIVDTMDHPHWSHVPAIDIDLLQRWKGGNTYRIFGYNIDEIIAVIERCITNALIIFEDSSKYMAFRSSEDTRRLVFDSKQKNNDIVFLFHGFMSMPPDLFRTVDNIVLFKTSDHPECRKRDIPNYPELLEAYNKVQTDPSPIAKLTVNIFE